jgi:hypothetical protein
MTNFLEIAQRNAARGFRVIPLRGKEAFLRGWPQLATTDENRIRDWAGKFPDYNCGVAGGPDVIIIDSDRVSRLKELSGEHGAEWFNTYAVSSGRPDRAHFYFRATPEALDFGNKKWKEPDVDGHVFEVKGSGTQVTAEGSVHPITGGTYGVTQDLPLIPFPAGLLAVLRETYGKANPTGKREWALPVHDGEGRDDFLIQQAGKLRHVGASEATIRAHLEELNSDPSVIADPKSEADLDRIAQSAAHYEVPLPVPNAVIGSAKTEPDAAKTAVRVRPEYPISAWEGTVVAEFTKLCAQDNNIPGKMFAESFRCVLGAVVGDRLPCPGVEGCRALTPSLWHRRARVKVQLSAVPPGSLARPSAVPSPPYPPACGCLRPLACFLASATLFGSPRGLVPGCPLRPACPAWPGCARTWTQPPRTSLT